MTTSAVAAGAWAVLALSVLVQAVGLPWIAQELVGDYPELQSVATTLLAYSILCFVPVEIAAALTGLAFHHVLSGGRGSGPPDHAGETGPDRRTQTDLAAAATFLVLGAAAGIVTMLWASGAVRGYGMNPGIGLALLTFVGLCLAGAAVVLLWRARLGSATRSPEATDRRRGTTTPDDVPTHAR
ncbi:hypothetical protein CZ771_08490 [Actinomycetales bacterium JB111]|nr:hypothetical protein CZ771_08490 [Actinomycetales bacterium JB111]